MLRNSLRMRLLVPVLALVLVVVVVLALILATVQAGRVQSDVSESIQHQSRALQSLLSVTRSIMLERVQNSMRLLRSRGEALGTAKLGAPIAVPGRNANDLLLGNKPQGNTFDLVDGVTQIMDGTATLFARTDDDFVRISTNVKKDDGSRAIGTQLDPKGPVIVEIRKGKHFYGVVDILGSPYVSGYEPIFDEARKDVLGIWYVGYKTDLAPLDAVISESTVLQSGFVALFDSKQKLRFRSKAGPGSADIEKIAAAAPPEWNVVREDVPGWGFTLISAYPKSDVSDIILRQTVWIAGIGLLVVVLLLVLQSALIWSRVLRPIQHLTKVAEELSLGKMNQVITEVNIKDEIGTLAKAISRLSNSVRLAMERLNKR
ncbi:MAG TPA: Cache 3/Cache 2 fusion domain-containing protein [Rudaea sp.]